MPTGVGPQPASSAAQSTFVAHPLQVRPTARLRFARDPDERRVLEHAIQRVTEQVANAHGIVGEGWQRAWAGGPVTVPSSSDAPSQDGGRPVYL
jgi:hypothetical protein